MKNSYEIYGSIVYINIARRDGTQLQTLIDLDDLEKVLKLDSKIYAHKDNRTGKYYAYFHCKLNGKARTGVLHRYLLNATRDLVVDHIKGNTLDNRRSETRLVTRQQNGQNRQGALRNSKTGIRGICFDSKKQKWVGYVKVNGKSINAGTFKSKDEAVMAVSKFRNKMMPFSEQDKTATI